MKKTIFGFALIFYSYLNTTEPLLPPNSGYWSEEIKGTIHWFIYNVNNKNLTDFYHPHVNYSTSPALFIEELAGQKMWKAGIEGTNKSAMISADLIKKALAWGGSEGISFLKYKIDLANSINFLDTIPIKVGNFPCCTLFGGLLGAGISYAAASTYIKTSSEKCNKFCTYVATINEAALGAWLLVNLVDNTPLAYMPCNF